MASMCGTRLKYPRNGFSMLEMAKICGKWLNYLINGLINCEMTKRFGKLLKFWELAQTYMARLKYQRYGISMCK